MREMQRRVVVGQAVQAVDLQVDRHPLRRCRLELPHARVLLPRLERKLTVEEFGDGTRPHRDYAAAMCWRARAVRRASASIATSAFSGVSSISPPRQAST